MFLKKISNKTRQYVTLECLKEDFENTTTLCINQFPLFQRNAWLKLFIKSNTPLPCLVEPLQVRPGSLRLALTSLGPRDHP